MIRNIIIAIDGFSSCGKSTLAGDLARALHYIHVDSGAMYRAVTLYFIRHHIDLNQPQIIADALSNIQISFRRSNDGCTTLLNAVDVEAEIRGNAVNQLVSPVAAISAVRQFLVAQQREIGKARTGLVMDGRDIGTVVFPDADLKIFLTATMEIRVERRYTELIERGIDTTRQEVEKGLAYRDHVDSTREDSPLKQADDAIVIDNSALSREDQLKIVLDLAHAAMAREHSDPLK